jgi:hypothetical protein
MRQRIAGLALLCAIAPVGLFGLLEKRKPTDGDEKAIARYVETMNKVLDQFRSPDWDERINHVIEHPMLNNMDDRPLDMDELLQRTYEVRRDSKRYQTMILPRQQKLAQAKDATQKDLERAQIEHLMHLQVEVHCNMLVVPMITGPDSKRDPKVPGATFVHLDRNNPFGHGVAYILFFSNGRPGKWDETNSVYRNVFVHPPNSPYIENLEIRIYGPPGRIQELLRKVNWKQVNAALTL